MSESPTALIRLFRELRRRRVFRVAGLYVVGAWLVMQSADVFFPGWGIPDSAINTLLMAAVMGFPLALIFGWLYDISPEGIRRTAPTRSDDLPHPRPLAAVDYLILAAFFIVAAFIVKQAVSEVLDVPRAPTVHVESERPLHSVAVLPFANISTDPDNEPFCDGVSEEILHRLSEFRELQVIGRTSSFLFKNSDFDIPRIAEALGVRYLLQGSVRKQGNDLRITAQLVDESGLQLWSESFDRQLEAIFQLQSEIAESVAVAVASEVAQVTPMDDDHPDIEAYQHYLIGREYLHSRVAGFIELAREELEKAVAISPNYAPALAELAIALTFDYRWLDNEASREAARAAIDRALELDPRSARAHAALGLLLQGNPVESEAALNKALALDPTMSDAANWLMSALTDLGRREEALEVARRAARIDPLLAPLNLNLAGEWMRTGDYPSAERTMKRLIAVPRPAFLSYAEYVDLLVDTGRLQEAVALSKRFVLDSIEQSTDGRAPRVNGMAAWLLARSYSSLGLWDATRHWLDQALPGFDFWILGPGGRYEAVIRRVESVAEEQGVAMADLTRRLREDYGKALTASDRHALAIEMLEPLLEQREAEYPLSNQWWPQLIRSYQATGGVAEANRLIELARTEAEELHREGRFQYLDERAIHAQVLVLAGEGSAALDELEWMHARGWLDVHTLVNDPLWEPMRQEPRFQQIVASMERQVAAQREAQLAIDARDGFADQISSRLAPP